MVHDFRDQIFVKYYAVGPCSSTFSWLVHLKEDLVL